MTPDAPDWIIRGRLSSRSRRPPDWITRRQVAAWRPELDHPGQNTKEGTKPQDTNHTGKMA